MKLVAADADTSSLALTESSLRSVFPDAEVICFTDAMSTYKYCLNHSGEIAAAFLPVILKPFDGIKLRGLMLTFPVRIEIVFTLREESGELCELIESNNVRWRVVKPVTPEKVAAVAREMVSDCWEDSERCRDCALFWCDKRPNSTSARIRLEPERALSTRG
ncbi:MAG: hypothetical protein Q4D04_10085 [Clostridia bacterium]|nr:hypothetical protein [Clostridia bacterium]